MVPRELFIERTVERVVTKLVGPKEKLTKRDWENRVLEKQFQEEEEREDQLLNQVVHMEIGNNFSLFSMWACRHGEEEARHRQRVYAAKLHQEKERIIQIWRSREILGLRTRDVVDRIRALHEFNTVVDGVRELHIQIPVGPPPTSTRGRLMALVKERLEERAARPIILRGSGLDIEAAIR